MNYDEKIQHELEHIPEEKKEQLYYVIRTFRRQSDMDSRHEKRNNHLVHDPQKEYPYTKAASDWEEITDDPYYALMKIREAMREGNFSDAHAGIEELYKLQTLEEEELLMKALANVMEAIILWKESDTWKTTDNLIRIHRGRDDIELQVHEGTPVDEKCMEKVWNEAFQEAWEFAEIKLRNKPSATELTKDEVLYREFNVPQQGGGNYG